jgi:purine-nucleoside phosphorylase
VTNSAGGLNPEFNVGDLMLLSDHLNMMGINPLLGENDDRFGPRFPDMSFAYHPQLRVAMLEAAQAADIKLQTGVYCALSGPSYETPAEIRMFRTLGADAVGMSTVPEIIALNHMQKACVGMSLITNLAAGISDTKLTHEEVKETAAAATQKIIELLKSAIVKIDRITLDS